VIVVVSFDSEDGEILVVDSRLVATDLNIEHESFVRTIDSNKAIIESSFGVLYSDSDNKGRTGRPEKFFWLTEEQSTFLMTLSRNTPEVILCKANLVKAFFKARDLLKDKFSEKSYVPYWYQRAKIALSDLEKPLPEGYFCIYLRMMDLFFQLETRVNYIIPDISPKTGRRLIPDISIGKKFNDFLRSDEEIDAQARKEFLLGSSLPIDLREEGKDFFEIVEYNHVYPPSSHRDKNIWPAKGYPIKYASIFDYYLQEYWIPDRSVQYLKERDPDGIQKIQKTLSQFPPEVIKSLQGTLLGKFIRALPPAED
jgi:phage regulator Rha-like protein